MTKPTQRLRDKIILITGAGSGIGRAAALRFAEEGATVILTGKTVKKLETLYDEIMQKNGPEPAIFPVNFLGATPAHYQELADSLQQNFGRLDGLLHNAAILNSLTPIEHYPVEQWYNLLQVNLNAPFLLTQALLPLLKQSSSASIVFTTADVGHYARAYWGAYAVSKAGIESFAKILAEEFETNTHIRVNTIDPGKVSTQLRRKAFPAEDAESLPKPETIMEKYVFLMSEESIKINGELVAIMS
jgi:NAD(P)-dependent dehydrogenase (short-subunit alcohol dehydrogenase family)